MERIQTASEPLGGHFTLVVRGNGYDGKTTPLSHNVNTDEVKITLMKSLPASLFRLF